MHLHLLLLGLVSDGPTWLPAGVGCPAARSRQDSSAGEGGSARSHPLHQVQQFSFLLTVQNGGFTKKNPTDLTLENS
jgi:hypothetical protein